MRIQTEELCLMKKPQIAYIRLLKISKIKRLRREAVPKRLSAKKVFLKISQNSQQNTCARAFFLNSEKIRNYFTGGIEKEHRAKLRLSPKVLKV